MTVCCNVALPFDCDPGWPESKLVGFPASSHPAIRDVAKTYVLQAAEPAPGAELKGSNWPVGRVDWEGKTADRQPTNFTVTGPISQALGKGLWITKCLNISSLWLLSGLAGNALC